VFKRVTGPFRNQFEQAFLHIARQFDAFTEMSEPFTPTLAFSDPRAERAREERLREMYQAGGLSLREYVRRRGDEDLANDEERYAVEVGGTTVNYGDHPRWVAKRLLSEAGATDPDQGGGGDSDGEQSRSVRNVVEVGDTEVDLTPPGAMVTAAELAREKKQELDVISDCGTGAGAESARQITNDEITSERIDDIAAYLTSHEEDVAGITDPPTDWSTEEWEGRTTGDTDDPRCGPVQYALWGGTATGTGLEWAQRKANEVARAKDEEEPY